MRIVLWVGLSDGVNFGCHRVSGLADAAMVEVVVVDGDLPPPHWMLESFWCVHHNS